TSTDALNILDKYKISNNVTQWLKDPASQTIKPDDPLVKNAHFKIIFNATDMLDFIEKRAKIDELDHINLGEQNGEARELAKEHAKLILERPFTKPTLVFSGGETTVTVKGNGRGGRNCEYLLSLAIALGENQNIYAIAADTDGIDGMEDNAGAMIAPDSLTRAEALNLSLPDMLDNNDSYNAFKKLGDLITTGPTRTNVNDFRAILVLPGN
ncbi:MAG: glycerate kinase, partial [Kordiimonadaceae bacterium]|nr:glycerate kinase [Kordiimonadaceae bacterium]